MDHHLIHDFVKQRTVDSARNLQGGSRFIYLFSLFALPKTVESGNVVSSDLCLETPKKRAHAIRTFTA